jgi:uncharacterized protein YukE
MSLTKDYIDKIEKQLGELGSKLDELAGKVKAEAKMKYDETADSMRAHLDESLSKAGKDIESQVKEWETKMNELKGKGMEEAKKEYEEMINNIRPKIKELNEALQELKKSGKEAAEELGTGAKSALNILKDSFKKAREKFNK